MARAPAAGPATGAPAAEAGPLAPSGDGVEARLSWGSGEQVLRFSGPAAFVSGADASVVATLPVAMRTGLPLRVEGPVSPRLLSALPRAQAILSGWDRRFSEVEVEAQAGDPEPGSARGRIAAFFTGGVDSWYTALRHRDSIDALVYIHGFDVVLTDHARRAQVSAWVREGAEALGLPLIEIETNLRPITRPVCGWQLYHGAALGSAALALGGGFDRVLVAGGRWLEPDDPLGSHPLLDPLWSTESVEIVHDGATRRADKLALLSEFEPALRRLRACWQEGTSGFNCGRCEKCLRTMAGLRIVGALERAPTFPDRVPLWRLRRLRLNSSPTVHMRENLEVLSERGPDPALERALRHVVARGPRRFARHERRKRRERIIRRRLRRTARRLRRRLARR